MLIEISRESSRISGSRFRIHLVFSDALVKRVNSSPLPSDKSVCFLIRYPMRQVFEPAVSNDDSMADGTDPERERRKQRKTV